MGRLFLIATAHLRTRLAPSGMRAFRGMSTRGLTAQETDEWYAKHGRGPAPPQRLLLTQRRDGRGVLETTIHGRIFVPDAVRALSWATRAGARRGLSRRGFTAEIARRTAALATEVAS